MRPSVSFDFKGRWLGMVKGWNDRRDLGVGAWLIATVMGCHRDTPAEPMDLPAPDQVTGRDATPEDAQPLPPLVLESTSALISRPEVAAAVDALAAMDSIESSHVGAGGVASKVWPAWDVLVKVATDEELLALLRHEAPSVRGYTAQHLVRNRTNPPLAILPLLGDETPVKTVEGCMMGTSALGDWLFSQLCGSPVAAAALLAEAGGSALPPQLAETLRRCMARTHRGAAPTGGP